MDLNGHFYFLKPHCYKLTVNQKQKRTHGQVWAALFFPRDGASITVQKPQQQNITGYLLVSTHTRTNTNTVNHSCFLWWNKRLSFVPETRREQLGLQKPTWGSDRRGSNPDSAPLCAFTFDFLPVSDTSGHSGSCSVTSTEKPCYFLRIWSPDSCSRKWGNHRKCDVLEREEENWRI